MGRIFYLMGKSACGKDRLCKALMEDKELNLNEVVLYTTRPKREGEQEGREYFFLDDRQAEQLEQSGKVIEERCYQTVHGPWKYITVDDGQIQLEKQDYLIIGTLESYKSMKAYFGKDKLVPLYITVDDGIRLQRALNREREQDVPKYAEMCRRFLTDEADFAEEKLREAEITKAYVNMDFERCMQEIKMEILSKGKDGLI